MTLNRVFAAITFLVLVASVCVLWPASLAAQAPSAYPYVHAIVGDGTTLQNQTVCENASGQASQCGAGVTNGYLGICVAGCGTKGTNYVAFAGQVGIIMDGTSTVQHYVQLSATAGEGHDTGAATYPTAGGAVIGRITQTSVGAGSQSMVDLFPPEIQASAGGGGTGAYTQICKTVGGATINIVGTPTYNVTATCSIPAHTLDTTGKCLHIRVMQYKSSGGAADNWEMTFGGTTTGAAAVSSGSGGPMAFDGYVCETGANAQQIYSSTILIANTTGVAINPTTAAATTSSVQTLALQGACSSACSEVITPLQMTVDSY